MCIYMNRNVESHLPLAKNLLHLYLYCVCPFSQIRSSVSSYRVSCELKFCPRTRSWQSDYSHLNGNLCSFSNLNRSPRKKNLMGNHLKPEEEIFCAPLMQFRRCTVQVSIGNGKGPNEKQFGKTQYHRNKGLEVMSRTGSYLDIRPVRVNYYWILSSQTPKY